ncbi:MAG: DUF3160 domain-containing protein [Armatimonadetes bacterium]|nr:DUF3160 domain-containing protein [Armatimonadota bacterium]
MSRERFPRFFWLKSMAAFAVLIVVTYLALRVSSYRGRERSEMPYFVQQGKAPTRRYRPVEIPEKLSSEAQKVLERNGFVVLSDIEADHLQSAYLHTSPNFITSDAVLYVFHCLFRGGLSAYEKQSLLPLCESVVRKGLSAAEREWERRQENALLAEPARRNLIFFGVANSLLDGPVPASVQKEVEETRAKVMAATATGCYPEEDYTMYRVRGVYTTDEDLTRYFRVMKWLGRRILPIIPGKADKPQDADIKLRQALLLGELLSDNRSFRKIWTKLFDEISFFIALPESYTPLALRQVARKLGVSSYDDAALATIRNEFSKPSYRPSRITIVPQSAPGEAPEKYVLFMGERFIPDGAIMQETCFPFVPDRTVPNGLDVGYCLFDLPAANTHLSFQIQRHSQLGGQLEHLHAEFCDYGVSDRKGTIYSGWVRAIRAAARPAKSRFLPKALTTSAWQDKCLNTTLASWTQMRHDFILYAAQPMIPGCAGMSAFVEPVPETYHELAAMSESLSRRGMVGFEEFAELCHALEKVARAEIVGADWRKTIDGKTQFDINSFGQWLLHYFTPHVAEERPCEVVDVASNSNAPNPVLHEATGPFNLIVLRVEQERSPRNLYRGWVFSYYEFTRDHFERMTDEQWESMVLHGKHRAYRPEWTRSFLFRR